MKVLIICRGPIAEEALRIISKQDMPKPHLVVSKREWLDNLEAQAPWLHDWSRLAQLHVINDYSDEKAILDIIKKHKIDFIYVGYGFFAENADFARKCEALQICFVGPSSKVLDMLGLKDKAREICKKLEIPTIPGSDCLEMLALKDLATKEKEEADVTLQKLLRKKKLKVEKQEDIGEFLSACVAQAQEQGIDLFSQEHLLQVTAQEIESLQQKHQGPIRIKASAGGGGKGQRVVSESCQSSKALREVWSEIGASKVGGNKSVILEAEIASPRHLEVQILGDGENVVHFAVRDCSLQTPFYQKLVEIAVHEPQLEDAKAQTKEAYLKEELQQEQRLICKLQESAVKLAKAINYRGAGTVEFIVGPGRKYYFLEVNPRIQVEHGVSEEISQVHGKKISLVAEQLRIATGDKLGYTQKDITFSGYALETRISLLDSQKLQPAPGAIIASFDFAQKEGVRLEDSGIARTLKQRLEIAPPPFYDANIALNIYHGENWERTLETAITNLQQAKIEGTSLATTVDFHIAILSWIYYNQKNPLITTEFVGVYLYLLNNLQQQLQKKLGKTLDVITASHKRKPLALHNLLKQVYDALIDRPNMAVVFLLRYDVSQISAITALENLIQILAIAPWEEDKNFLIEAREFLTNLENLADLVGIDSQKLLKNLAQEKTLEAKKIAKTIAEIEKVGETEALLALRQKYQHYASDAGKFVEALATVLDDSGFRQLQKDKKSTTVIFPKSISEIDIRAKFLEQQAKVQPAENEVVSPILGLFYSSVKPGDPPMVKKGDRVLPGQTLFLVGSMKVYIEVQAPREAVVKEILVANETLVAIGQTVIILE